MPRPWPKTPASRSHPIRASPHSEALLRYDRPYSGYAPIMGTPWLTAFAQRSRFAEGFQSSAEGQSDTGKFRAELYALPRDEWPSMIRRLVSDQISLLLRRTIDPDRPLSEYGLDSLGNLELRTRIETETGYASAPHTSPQSGAWPSTCAISWKPWRLRRQPPDGRLPKSDGFNRGENVACRAIGSRNAGRLGTEHRFRRITWQPSAASLEKAAQAPVSDVPVSYMQAQHIRGYYHQKAMGLDYSRLMVVSCDAPGRCDIRAMSYVINAHLRRHDTFRSRFEYSGDGPIVRRTMENPSDIEFVPIRHGELTLAQARELVVSTPDPLQWDCFRFGINQGEDHFTFFVSIDHVHVDAAIVGGTLTEFYMMYAALVGGNPPIPLPEAGSYDDFCVRQQRQMSALTADSPEVGAWLQFTDRNDGCLPGFPLPLGDPLLPCDADIVTVSMLDEQQTARFESACTAAGARFLGGVMACFGLAEYELTGSRRISDSRRSIPAARRRTP